MRILPTTIKSIIQSSIVPPINRNKASASSVRRVIFLLVKLFRLAFWFRLQPPVNCSYLDRRTNAGRPIVETNFRLDHFFRFSKYSLKMMSAVLPTVKKMHGRTMASQPLSTPVRKPSAPLPKERIKFFTSWAGSTRVMVLDRLHQ